MWQNVAAGTENGVSGLSLNRSKVFIYVICVLRCAKGSYVLC
jgi:hypothetical protein